jgi:hypothetical protein
MIMSEKNETDLLLYLCSIWDLELADYLVDRQII